MGVNITEFEKFEQELLKLIEELETATASENRLREAVRVEATRAEAAEAAQAGAERAAAEARAAAAAAAAAASHSAAALAKAHDDLAATKMQFELTERHRAVLEEKCSEMTIELEALKRELQKMKPLEASHLSLQRQFVELNERVLVATNDAKREASRLEAELRRVEKCAAAGAEIRERARLAAAAHVRERRMAAAELQHTNQELHNAKAELTKLSAIIAELQCRLAIHNKNDESVAKKTASSNEELLAEVRAALETERAGAARLERALAAALADNATLAAQMNSADNTVLREPEQPSEPPPTSASTNICPLDSFLAE